VFHGIEPLKTVEVEREKQPPAWVKIAISELHFAKEFAKAAGVSPAQAVLAALARIERETGRKLRDYENVLEEESANV
jgi:hypothetical protein